MGKVYGYLRCSHLDSLESGLGLSAQRERVQRYFSMLQLDYPDQGLTWGGFYEDQVVSAFRRTFLHRPEGRKLDRQLQKGDHVLFSRIDRAFRNVHDFTACEPMWRARGITLHFVDQKVDLSTANGRMFATIMVTIAEWESAMKSERIREAMFQCKRQGLVVGGRIPWGMTKKVVYGDVVYVTNKDERALMQWIVSVRDAPRKRGTPRVTWEVVRAEAKRFLALRAEKGLPPIKRCERGISERQVRHAYRTEKTFQREAQRHARLYREAHGLREDEEVPQ